MPTADHHAADLHQPDSSSNSLMLSGMLESASAEQLRQELLMRMGAGLPLSLDASSAGQVSTSAAQVLASALRTADARGLPLSIVDPSPDFLTSLEDLGLLSYVMKRVTPSV